VIPYVWRVTLRSCVGYVMEFVPLTAYSTFNYLYTLITFTFYLMDEELHDV